MPSSVGVIWGYVTDTDFSKAAHNMRLNMHFFASNDWMTKSDDPDQIAPC